ncbi:MAG: type III PLP-dependent enzyme, partial [Spirochaetia bacterium]|nr:type III PLP-dependent enzyme [Spirochaetia bacterium]
MEDIPEWPKIQDLLKQHDTPFLVVSLDRIRERYLALSRCLPRTKIYYSVKANPQVPTLKLLADLGSYFDIASIYELERCLSLGVHPDRISYGNTIKKEKDIRFAYEKGIRLFASDSEDDMKKIARAAPGSRVFFRLITEGSGADWPLSKKFGSHPDLLYSLIPQSAELGLDPYGLSFHVGSQQRDIGQWDDALTQCKSLFERTKKKGIRLKMINLGGGLPANYIQETISLETYAEEILRFLNQHFGKDEIPELRIEPGRAMVGDAGILATEVVLISQKNRRDPHRWVYLDAGLFGGLIETLGEAIKYPILTEKFGGPVPSTPDKIGKKDIEVILAGPTCDSMDIMYQHHRYFLPGDLKEGDRLFFMST